MLTHWLLEGKEGDGGVPSLRLKWETFSGTPPSPETSQNFEDQHGFAFSCLRQKQGIFRDVPLVLRLLPLVAKNALTEFDTVQSHMTESECDVAMSLRG